MLLVGALLISTMAAWLESHYSHPQEQYEPPIHGVGFWRYHEVSTRRKGAVEQLELSLV